MNPIAASRVVRQLVAGIKRIPAHPRLGVRLSEFDPREVRKIRAPGKVVAEAGNRTD